jgi:uncharacterized repeat protein (TIGR01451 family)
MFTPSEFNRRGIVALRHLGLAFVCVVVMAAAEVRCTAAQTRDLAVSIARRGLRPLGQATVQLSGAVTLQGVTDDQGHVTFPGVSAAGAITVTPSRSGFRFEPTQLTIPASANPATATFVAYPTSTDLTLSITTDNPNPLVGGEVNGVITLQNQGTAAATEISVAIGSLPGLVMENCQATQGSITPRAYDTRWTLPQLNPGASTQVNYTARATLAEANVLAVAQLEEMEQTDTAPLNNIAYLTVPTRAAQAQLSLTMTINPATAKVGQMLPVQLTVRNNGPQDATQIAIRSYCPPGASLLPDAGPTGLQSRMVIARLAPNTQVQLTGSLMLRLAGSFTLIANVTDFEQQLPAGATWPEARVNYTVQSASSHLTLFGFTDPPNPRVGDDVDVMYVVRNDGPDPVTGLQLFTQADSRLDSAYRYIEPNPPVPPVQGPFVFGDTIPVGSYTYQLGRYLVKAAGDLTNYFTVVSHDQLNADGADHPELYIPLHTLPADVGLSLDANPQDITVPLGGPVTIDFRVHNDGPQPAKGIFVDYSSFGLVSADLDEVIHADRTLRPGYNGYIDIVNPGETVRLRKHLAASRAGDYTDDAQIAISYERPDLLMPIATETIRLHVGPGTPPDLGISVNVDKPQVNVGEYAIFVVTVTNRAAQPAFSVTVQETDAGDVNSAFETVRSFGPTGDDRITTAWQRTIPRIDPGTSYSMSRTMRVRQAVTIPYLAKVLGVNGLSETEIPQWQATTSVAGVQVTSDIAPILIADRTNVKNGDLVNFAVIARSMSSRIASHVILDGAQSAGFQLLDATLSNNGYYWDSSRPQDLQSSQQPLWGWYEIRPQEDQVSWLSAYTVGAGQFTATAQLDWLDQLDGQPANNLATVNINSAPASGGISVAQTILPQNVHAGDVVRITTEIRNTGPDRVTGLCFTETASTNLELTLSPFVNGISGDSQTSIFDSLVRLPALERGQNYVWQRSYIAHSAGNASHRVTVQRIDQSPVGALPDNNAAFTVQPAQADLQLQFVTTPTVAQQKNIPTWVAVQVRNLGPAVATGVKVAVNVPADALYLGTFNYGPRANYLWSAPNVFQTALLPGESATVGFWVTPLRTGTINSSVQVVASDQTDPNLANNTLSWTFNVGAEPPVPQVLRLSKVRKDFFTQGSIAEVEIDQGALNRFAPWTTFYLQRSSNLRDWENLRLVGLAPFAPVTFTDHADPGVPMRTFRLSDF